MLLWCVVSRAAVVFAPPENSPDAATELKGIDRELADRNYSAAAKRLDGLLSARALQLANLSENTLVSVIAWRDQLPAQQREALAAEYAQAFAATARQSLDSTLNGRVPRPDELYAIARRYPMTAAAGSALAQAGDRSLQMGDFPAAQAFYELALREGFPMGTLRARKLEAIKKINAGVIVPVPEDLEMPTGPGAKPQATDRPAFAGALPFDAPWFGNPMMLGHAKFFPFACDDRILLSSWKGVAMLRENGQLLWNSPSPTAPGAFPVERAPMLGRGALFAPAVLGDVHGRPSIIVVRQPTAQGESQFVLRALRASDGRTLWSTQAAEARNEFSYAGLPTVSGRYVYTLAVQKTGVSSGNLSLCALDITTGQPLWQATLGSITEQGDIRFGGKFSRGQPLNLESFSDLSEPAVSGDLVLVSPNCGSLIAVGRFDGMIRWVHSYRKAEPANVAKPGRWMPPGEAEKSLQTRYRCTPIVCGDVVLTMPRDAPAVFAVDRAGGKRLWDTDIIEGFALAGGSGNMAVVCGTTLSGVDAVTAKLKWKYVPPRGVSLTGPAVVVGQTAIAPTTKGFIQLNVSDGVEKAVYAIPNFRHLLSTDTGKAAINDTGVSKAFGLPGTR